MERLQLATDALAFNKHLDKVFVATDGQVFATKNHAVNYANRLDDRTVEVFERGSEEFVVVSGKEYALNALDTIVLIGEAKSEDAIVHLLVGEERKTVLVAAEKKISLIRQEFLEEQAIAADEARKARETENPNNTDTTFDGQD